MTSAEFYKFKREGGVPKELKEEFDKLLKWEMRSAAAKRAVQTKRNRYRQWPCNRSKRETK